MTTDPHVAVFLDLFEDHLDRYHTLEHYFDAKCGITKHQTEDDILYAGSEVPPIRTKAQERIVDAEHVKGDFELRIPGAHNQFNAEVVCRIAEEVFGCREKEIREALSSFRGLPHRLEYAGTYDGIAYYDDSISTIPEAAINAVDAVPDTATVLIGGMDRGIDYDILINFIRRRSDLNFILAYASGKRIYEQVKDCPNVYLVEDLEQQVAKAGEITPQGCAVVMSNAAASYGYFKNFEERGDCFKKLIQKS